MENKITKEKILIITTILVVSIVFIGIGYAFFTANNPEGSTAQIISKSGRMLINYNDGTDNIIPVTNIQPSNENILIDKTFTLSGINTTTGNTKMMPFDISIEYQNTFSLNNLSSKETIIVTYKDDSTISLMQYFVTSSNKNEEKNINIKTEDYVKLIGVFYE